MKNGSSPLGMCAVGAIGQENSGGDQTMTSNRPYLFVVSHPEDVCVCVSVCECVCVTGASRPFVSLLRTLSIWKDREPRST